jgi:hypothetical protein
MRNHVVRLAVALALTGCFGCAPMGYLQLKEQTYYFDSASYTTWGDRTVLALSVENKQSWELLATTRQVWVVFPGEPVEGRCEIGPTGCSFRYVRNPGLTLGLLCTAREGPQPARCELPENFGAVAQSGTITVEKLVDDDRLEGHFEVVTASGPFSGSFKARFDVLTRQAAERQ